jgi:hypothetical protein
MIFLVQGKLRKHVGAKAEARNDVVEFARFGPLLGATKTEFQSFSKTLAPLAQLRLAAARGRLRRGYGLRLYYVTTGRCSSNIIEDARRAARYDNVNVSFAVIDGRQLLLLLAGLHRHTPGVLAPVQVMLSWSIFTY